MFLPSLMTLFIEKHVSNQVFQYPFATTYLLNLNPIFIVLLGIIVFFIWHRFTHTIYKFTTANQFAIGIMLMGFAFLVLDFGIYYSLPTGRSAVIWIVISYILQALAELYILPTGAAMICKLTPTQHHGFFMGVWIFTIQMGNCLAGQMINLTYKRLNTPFFNLSNHFYIGNFTRFGIMALTLGVLTALLAPRIQARAET